jgi:superfamily II DNA or RNA helicase
MLNLASHIIRRDPRKPLHYYQKDAVQATELSWEVDDWTRSMVVIPTGGGKCFQAGTPILMANGTLKKVEEIQPSDMLVGPDGKGRVVTSLVRGSEMMYRITPSKGDPYTVNESHLLSLRVSPSGDRVRCANGKFYEDDDVAIVSVADYLKSNSTFRHRVKGWRSGVKAWPSLSFSGRRVVPPYILGVWLGDGTSSQASITSADKEVSDEWIRFSKMFDGVQIRVRTKPGNSASLFHATVGKTRGEPGMNGGRRNPIQDCLEEIGVLKNKHIPRQYLVAGEMQRLELLAGLIDTDGCSARSGFDYITKLPALASDVAFLCRSLGFSAYISPCVKRDQSGTEGNYYRISIQGDCNRVPVRVPRKKPHSRSQKKNILRHGITVTPVGIGDYFGFEVSGPDNQFLLGDFTVVHNSLVTGELCARSIEGGGRTLFLAHTKELVRQPKAAFEEDFGCAATIEMGAMKADCSPMVFACVPTMVNRVKKGLWRPDTFKRIVFDETHRVLAAGHAFVAEHFGKEGAQIVGCTATPRRGDKRDLLQFFDGKAYDKDIRDLWREGFLIEPTIVQEPLNIVIQHAKPTITDEDVGHAIEPYLEEAADRVMKVARGRCGLSFLPLRATARKFCEMLCRRGLKAEYVGGDIEEAEQKQIKDRLILGKIDHVCNAQIWGEGVDIRPCNLLVDLRPTQSWPAAMQKWGRLTRTYVPKAPYASPHGRWPKKTDALLLDFCFETSQHSMLVRPAAMLAKDDVEEEAISEVLAKGGGGNLMQAARKVANDREETLRKRLMAMATRKGATVSAVEFFLGQRRMDLVEYEPSQKWELAPPTDAQIETITKAGIDADSVQSRGHAKQMIDMIVARRKKDLATAPQCRYAQFLGHPDPWNLTFTEANRWLDAHAKKR